MKYRFILYSAALVLAFSLISCEEDFDPKGNFQNKVVLNCIVEFHKSFSGCSSSTRAFVSKSYAPIDIFDPDTINSPILRGAVIKIIQYYSNIELRDYYKYYSSKLQDTITVFRNYYSPYPPGQGGYVTNRYVKLSAQMPDGKILTSETVFPAQIWPELNHDFNRGITPKINQFIWGNGVKYKWDSIYSDHLVCAYMSIPFYISSTKVSSSVRVPLKYVKQNGKMIPVYPSVGKYNSIHFEFAAIDSALKRISAGDPNKKNYEISGCNVRIIELDSELSTYYSSIHGSLDTYSVRLDENVYSNIRGGLGIFGSLMNTYMSYPFEKSYIESFGYTHREYY